VLPVSSLPHDDLGDRWRAARPAAAGVHLDSAACSRQSTAVLDAVARHARHEAEIGGYVAQGAADGLLQQGRSVLAGLVGMAAADVAFTESATASIRTLLAAWRLPPGSRVAVLPGEFWHNAAAIEAAGLVAVPLPADGLGRADVEGVERLLRTDPPALVHLTLLASHRGVLQPGREVAAVCRAAGVPLVMDLAQALGHVDCDLGADAVYGTSRKWLAGPRGVGFLVLRPSVTARLTPVSTWLPDRTGCGRGWPRWAGPPGSAWTAGAAGGWPSRWRSRRRCAPSPPRTASTSGRSPPGCAPSTACSPPPRGASGRRVS
jgi:pyridoxal 5-phosphate dependent beta-lyase